MLSINQFFISLRRADSFICLDKLRHDFGFQLSETFHFRYQSQQSPQRYLSLTLIRYLINCGCARTAINTRTWLRNFSHIFRTYFHEKLFLSAPMKWTAKRPNPLSSAWFRDFSPTSSREPLFLLLMFAQIFLQNLSSSTESLRDFVRFFTSRSFASKAASSSLELLRINRWFLGAIHGNLLQSLIGHWFYVTRSLSYIFFSSQFTRFTSSSSSVSSSCF